MDVVNDAKRMAQLWQERAEGKKHLWFDPINSEWGDDDPNDNFHQHIKYKLKPEPETAEEAADKYANTYCGYYSEKLAVRHAFLSGVIWREQNPESKE